MLGHVIGIVCGIASLWLVGLHEAPSVAIEGINVLRVLAVALSLASAGAVMVLMDAPHPPAGATALIVSLGLITRPAHLGVMVFAVSLLTVQAIVLNRLAGIAYPFWATPRVVVGARQDSGPETRRARGAVGQKFDASYVESAAARKASAA